MPRYFRPFFPSSRLFSQSLKASGAELATNYFFVDTNVIVGYRRKQFAAEIPHFVEFIENPRNQFIYTETVLKELQQAGVSYPESFPADDAHKYFRFVDSKISEARKTEAIALLHDLWERAFPMERKTIERGFGLSEDQLRKFRNDLFIILEAGFSCYAKGVLPDTDLRAPPLLTNNMKLFNKFLSREKAAEVLENAINLSGLEHLIPVQLLADTVEAWLIEQPAVSLVRPRTS